MMRSQIGSPNPSPFLFLALKNGRKILGKSLSTMPKPVSTTDMTIVGSAGAVLSCLASTFKLPPIGIASTAPAYSLAATLGFLFLCLGAVAWIFRTGYRLKS